MAKLKVEVLNKEGAHNNVILADNVKISVKLKDGTEELLGMVQNFKWEIDAVKLLAVCKFEIAAHEVELIGIDNIPKVESEC